MPRTLLGHVPTILVLPILVGCSDWPRWGNLPKDDTFADSNADLREKVNIAWQPAVDEEEDDNNAPATALRATLQLGQGTPIQGNLAGTGWIDKVSPDAQRKITDPNCNDSVRLAPENEEGDYAYDVDFFVVEVAEAGTLCARVKFDEAIGFDLLIRELPDDNCMVPTAPLLNPDGVTIGFDQNTDATDWAFNAVGQRVYAVSLAGYHPQDDTERGYDLGLALVPNSGNEPGLCPYLNGEVPE